MPLWKIAWRSIQQRALASFLTGLSMALGVSLVVAVLVMSGVVGKSFQNSAGLGYNVIVGAKGGELQLVFNTVYHISKPVGNIPYWYYKEFLEPSPHNGKIYDLAEHTDLAVPVCLGDYFGNFRVIGTNTHMFDDLEYAPDRKFEFAEGRNFKQEEFFTAVIGAQVAKESGKKIGDKINPTHAAPEGHEHSPFTIVGILKRTGTPADNGVYVNIEGFYLMAGHSLRDRDEKQNVAQPKPLPEEEREVTAILWRTKNASDPAELVIVPGLVKEINRDDVAQAVLPIGVISKFFDEIIGPLTYVLFALAVLIVIVSGIGIMVSIYNSMSERRHEIAVMRALGAARGKVMLIVLLESILLALGGGLCGWVLGHVLIGALGPWISGATSVQVGFLQFAPEYELILIPALIVLAALVGYLPALSAYRTDVAKALTANP